MTKERYFTRMSIKLDPNLHGFEDGRWILSEDLDVEHLLDVFTFADPYSNDIWEACINFMSHLVWCKPRQTLLRTKIEGLPDNHHSKPRCLLWLASLSGAIGNYTEEAILLNRSLKLERKRRNDTGVALVLKTLSTANKTLGRYEEGVRQAREALEIYERLGAMVGRAQCLNALAGLLHRGGRLDAAENAAVESIQLLPEKGQEDQVCGSHYTLGDIHRSKGEREKAIYHYDVAHGIASSLNWRPPLFGIHLTLARLFLDENRFNDAQVHVERAKSHALDNAYYLGRAVDLQARIWYRQRRFKDAASEALCAQEIFKKLGNSKYLEACKTLLRKIEGAIKSPPHSSKLDSNSELQKTILCPTLTDPPSSGHSTVRRLSKYSS